MIRNDRSDSQETDFPLCYKLFYDLELPFENTYFAHSCNWMWWKYDIYLT